LLEQAGKSTGGGRIVHIYSTFHTQRGGNMKKQDITDTHLHIMRIVGKLNELDKNVSKAEIQTKILDLCVQLKQCAADEENYYKLLFTSKED